EDVAAGVVELVEPDSFDAHSGDPHSRPCTPHEESIQNANVAHDVAGRKANQRSYRGGQGPEYQHEDGADHLPLSPAVAVAEFAPVTGCASPFSQAIRRA